MAATKKVGLRVGWSGDHFHTGDLHFDDQGAWDKDDKAVTFTEAEAVEMAEHALDAGVELVSVELQDAPATPLNVKE